MLVDLRSLWEARPFQNGEQPNPSSKSAVAPEHHALASTATNTKPFNPPDWITPTKNFALAAIMGFAAPNLLATTLATTQAPFQNTDFPNPQSRAGTAAFDACTQNLLLSTLAPTGKPFAQFDWPNPGVKSFAPGEHHALASTATNIKPFVPIDWTLPTSKATLTAFDSPNLLVTTLGLTGTPFKPIEWTNPKQKPGFWDWSYSVTTLLPVGQKPFAQTDWPLPDHKQTPSLEHFSRTAAGTPGTPFKPIDWPNPNVRKQPPLDWQYTVTIGLPVSAKPFATVDWPNPPKASAFKYPTTYRPQADAVGNPLAQYDWPNPLVAKRPVQDWQYSILNNTLSIVPPRPFKQLDWPNPNVRRQPLQDWNYSVTAILPVGAKPFAQNDWPLPNIRSQPLQDWQYTITANLPVAGTPFFPIDWPNPASRGTFKHTQSYRPPADIDRTPFNQDDWPNPSVRRQPVQDWQYSVTARLPVGAKPFSQTDWPNPNVRNQPLQDWIYSVTATLPVGATPFSQSDWPNPNVRSQTLQAWDYSTNFLLPIGDTPFAQTDWPNPSPAHAFVYLFEPPNLLTSTLAIPGAAPPNLHRLVMDIETGRLGWMVSGTHAGSPIIVVFLD